MKIRNIILSIKENTFIDKVKIKICCNLLCKNKNAYEIEKQEIIYNKLKKKYKHILDNFTYKTREDNNNFANNIFICWLQGIENAPPIVKACINSIYKNSGEKKVIILSENNIKEYVKLPKYIVDKWKKGYIGNAHFTDILRVELLCKYGGIWIDSTVFLSSDKIFKYIENEPLFVFKSMDLYRHNCIKSKASNWFISAERGNKILLLTRKLLHQYWKEYNDILDYYIFHILFTIATEKYNEQWENIPMFNNHSPHTLMFELGKKYSDERWDQIINMSCVHKLQHHIRYDMIEDSFYNYIISNYEK